MSQRQSEDIIKILANQEKLKNTLAYVYFAQRYYQACEDYSFAQHEWPQPMPFVHPLSAEGPSFELWVVPSEPVGVYRLIVDEPDSLYADKDFIPDVPNE